MTASAAYIALVTAAAWFFVFFVVHVGGLRTGFENARWLLVSYAASLLGTLVTVIAVTVAARQPMQAIFLAAMIAALTSACLFALYIPALYAVLTSISVETLMLLRHGGALREADLYDRFAGPPDHGAEARDAPPQRLYRARWTILPAHAPRSGDCRDLQPSQGSLEPRPRGVKGARRRPSIPV